MADRNKLINLHSGVLDKTPSVDFIEYGEIAVNFNADGPFMSFKVSGDSNASVVMCRPTPSILDFGGIDETYNIRIDEDEIRINTFDINSDSNIECYALEAKYNVKSDFGFYGGFFSGTTISGTGEYIAGNIQATGTIEGKALNIATGTEGAFLNINTDNIQAYHLTYSGESISGTNIYASTGFNGGTFSGTTISGTGEYIAGNIQATGKVTIGSGITMNGGIIQCEHINVNVLDCSNTLTATSFSGTTFHAGDGFYQDSDENLKNFDSDINVDLEKLKLIPKKYFYWKEGNADKQIGTSAQKVQEQFPEIVSETESGTLSIDYAKLSIIALAAIDKLNDKINALEEEIKELKK